MRLLASFIASLIALVVLSGPATAQILKIVLKDPKKTKSLSKFCIEVNNELQLVGEAKSGLNYDAEKHSFGYVADSNVDLWVTDMDNPKACPYRLDKGEKVKAGGKTYVTFKGSDIKDVEFLMQDQSFWGLTKEYSKRDSEIDDLKKERDALKRGTSQWKLKQTAVIQTMERLKSWLDETIYSKAAKKVAKEIEAEQRSAKDATAQRLEMAKASIKLVPISEDLARIAKETFGEAVVFHQAESQHVRIIYREECGDERVKGLLELAENLIDGFRVQFIDPFVADDYKDYIPDGLFAEYCFMPDEMVPWEQFVKKYYGMTFEGKDRERTIKMVGHGTRRSKAPSYVRTWRTVEQTDLEGCVTHTMGHNLANIHYNQDRSSDVADWLYEGVGNWLSLEYLGRNSVQCVEFKDLEYAKKLHADNSEESGLLKGTADLYHRLALDKGITIDQLALRSLAEMEDPDIAKAFSIYNFVAKTQGESGQRWLRACCSSGGVPTNFIAQWRKKSEEIFKTTGLDIFKKINDEWTRYAEEQVGGPISR